MGHPTSIRCLSRGLKNFVTTQPRYAIVTVACSKDEVDDAISKPVAAFMRHLAPLTGWQRHTPLHFKIHLTSSRSLGNVTRRRISAMA